MTDYRLQSAVWERNLRYGDITSANAAPDAISCDMVTPMRFRESISICY